MDEFNEDDDFSDLYADVEVQASSAICAMHGKTEVAAEKKAFSVNAVDCHPPWTRGDGVDDLKPRPCYVPFSNNLEVCDRVSANADLEGVEPGQLIDEVPGTNQSGSDFSYPRDSRHTRESHPESLDFHNPGLVHSSSDEGKQRQVIEPDSDGSEVVIEAYNDMIEKNESSIPEQEPSIGESESESDESERVIRTFNDTNERSESSMPEQEPSTGEPESSESGHNRRYRGFSSSPWGTLGNDDTRSHRLVKLTSVSADLKPREMVNKDYSFSRRSEKRIVGASTRDIRCDNRDREYAQRTHEHSRKSPRVSDCEFRKSPFGRQLSKYSDSHGSIRKERMRRTTSDRASNLRAHQRDSDAYDAVVKNVRIDHEKLREFPIFNSGRRNSQQFTRSENSSRYYYGFVSDDDRRPMYTKEQVCDAYPNVRHGGSMFDGYHLEGEQNCVNGKINVVDYEYYKDDWCNNRKHFDKERNHLNLEARKLTSYFPHDLKGRRTMGNKKEDGMRFIRRREPDMALCPGYGTDFIKERSSRFARHGGSEDLDRFNLVDDHDTFRDRREPESPRRIKRKYTSHFSGFDGAFCLKNEQSNRRYTRASALSSDEDRRVPRSGPFQRVTEKNFSVSDGPALKAKFSLKDRLGEPSQHGFNDAYFDNKECLMHHHTKDLAAPRSRNHQSSSLFNSDERITNSYQDHFDKNSYPVHQVSNSNVNRYRSRHLENSTEFQSGGSSYFEENSRSRRPEYIRTSDCDAEVVNTKMAGRCTRELRRDDEIDFKFGRIRDSIRTDSCKELYLRYRGSDYPPPSIEDRESCRRTTEARVAMNFYRNSYMEKDVNQEPKRLKESMDHNSRKSILADRIDKCRCNDDIEEGQIVSEDTSEKRLKSVIVSENVALVRSTIDRVVEGLDDQRIQEIMKKMEKRRERFKEPIITSNEDSEKTCKILHAVDIKPSRPSRKRRWI